MSLLNLNPQNHLTSKMFFDDGGTVGIARYDTVKYPEIDRLTQTQLGFFWRPEEVDLNTDRSDFQKLTEHEKHIFTSNLKRQILLDSVQTRAPAALFGSITSIPEMENWCVTWSAFESIHSRSYTHMIRNIFPNPSVVFDSLLDIKEIVECGNGITKYYDDFHNMSLRYQMLGFGDHVINGERISITPRELKKKLWLALTTANILEGVQFYISFCCSWAFAESRKLEGNAKIIRFICRDENLHLSGTQKLLKVILPKDDPDFVSISEETKDEMVEMFLTVIKMEKEWAKYLFKDGSIIGLNEELLCDYIDYLGAQRMRAIGLACPYRPPTSNPLPWTLSWISSKSVQSAPQETEQSQYIVGGVKQDAGKNDFGGFSL